MVHEKFVSLRNISRTGLLLCNLLNLLTFNQVPDTRIRCQSHNHLESIMEENSLSREGEV